MRAFSDETLMAYADGELDEATSAKLESALKKDKALVEQLAIFTKTRDMLSNLADASPPKPISDDMMARIRETMDEARAEQQDDANDNVVAFRTHRAAPSLHRKSLAIAASLALTLGLGAGYFAAKLGNTPETSTPIRIALFENSKIPKALSVVPAGEQTATPAGQIKLIASFRNNLDEFCREFELNTSKSSKIISVACHDGQQWDMRFAIASAVHDETSYVTASSLETLNAYLKMVGAGDVLSPVDEMRALKELAQ